MLDHMRQAGRENGKGDVASRLYKNPLMWKMILKENKMCNSMSRHIGKYEFCLVLYSL